MEEHVKDEQDFKEKLTWEEIEVEIDKVGDFFERIPDELKSSTAERFIYEIVNWGSYNHYEALGIFEEAKNQYCEVSQKVAQDQEYHCVESFTYEGCKFEEGETYTARYAGIYHSEHTYDVWGRDGKYHRMCKHMFGDHFDVFEEDED